MRKDFLSGFDWRFWGYFKTTDDSLKVIFNKERKKEKNRLSQKKRKEKKIKKRENIYAINAKLLLFNFQQFDFCLIL